ncbi:RNA-binding protein [Labrys sp. WJW]|uniref:RNA-binding S4 domain-containing protein n=1 Tax=Labrys sp. WJW TaxID=1737983 RepID=UPI00082E1D84|nr:RNA-binding protein [Labrys sp. WJW]
MSQAGSQDRLRIDKWLWHARVVKTRSLAAKLVADGHVRLNGMRTDTPAKAVKAGDVLTIALERTVRVYRVLALGDRRGPASEAQTLYEDLSPEPPGRPPAGSEQSDAG